MTTLVDPTATRHHQRPKAARLAQDARPVVGLIDGTLNKASLWGQGMLDAAQVSIQAVFPDAQFIRESMDPLQNHAPDLWAAFAKERYSAIVVTAGDCVTCTSRGVRDAVWAEIAGMPAAVVCTEAMLEVVGGVCSTYGMPDLAVYPVGLSLFGLSRTHITAITAEYVTELGAGFVDRDASRHS